MRAALITGLVGAALAVAATASAGGWATAGISPLPPDGMSAGTPWTTTITVLQHGRTPLAGVKPTLTIRNRSTGEARTFPATPAGQPGKYTAKVVFPSDGTWGIVVFDGFGQYGGAQRHTFKAVQIGGGTGSATPAWTIAGGAAIGIALGALFLLGRRRPAPVPAPVSELRRAA